MTTGQNCFNARPRIHFQSVLPQTKDREPDESASDFAERVELGATQKTTTDRYASLQRRYSFEHATLWKGARRVARVERGIERGTDL